MYGRNVVLCYVAPFSFSVPTRNKQNFLTSDLSSGFVLIIVYSVCLFLICRHVQPRHIPVAAFRNIKKMLISVYRFLFY